MPMCGAQHPEQSEVTCQRRGLHARHWAAPNDPRTGVAIPTYWGRLDVAQPDAGPKPGPEITQGIAPNVTTPTPMDEIKVRTGHDHPQTSHKAAERAQLSVGTNTHSIYGWILDRGLHGGTCEEAEAAFGLKHQTASPCFTWLHQNGWAVGIGTERQMDPLAKTGWEVYVACDLLDAVSDPGPNLVPAGGMRNFD